MVEEQITFDNPLQIKCKACAAPAEYDIIHQNYHCQYCGADTDLYAPVQQLARYRKRVAAKLQADTQSEKLKRYNCTNCGAVVVIDATEATGNCAFCGSKMVNSDFVESDAFPELIIPFKITLKEAQEQLKKWIAAHKNKQEAKDLAGRLDKLQGFYLPYQIVKGPVEATVWRDRSARCYECGGFVEEVAINTSKQMDNMLLEKMEPFDWREVRPFQYGYLAGLHTKLQDVDDTAIQNRIDTELEEAYRPRLEETLETQGLLLEAESDSVLRCPALMPVYVLNVGALHVAVNGQTGRVAVKPYKGTVTHYWWIEPVCLVLFVAALCQFVPLALGYDANFELTGMICLVAALISWAAYKDADNVIKMLYMHSRKLLAVRENSKISYVESQELQENATVEPVFFEKIGKKLEPVKIKFFTPERYAKIGLAAFLMLLLPCCVAILIVLLNVFISNGSISELSKINYRYGGAWWALFVPICYILWIAVIRRDIYDYPVLYKLLEDGSLERVKNLYPLRWKKILSLCFTSPLCWVALFILVLLVGSTGAMLM
jgi:hypothetical protein